MIKGYAIPEVVTGKPIDIGGSYGRAEATGRGVCYIAEAALRTFDSVRGKCPNGKMRVAVQGMGNVGGIAAKLLAEEGHKIVAVSDVSGGYANPNGLDIQAMLDYIAHSPTRSLAGYHEENCTEIDAADVLTCDCEVLLPCALENQITVKNAHQIKAKMIVEGANGPTTADADSILEDMGVVVIPDILANAGGVVVSYFEWVQNIQHLMWEEDEINGMLKKIILKAYDEVHALAEEYKTSMRMGAYMSAIRRLSKAKVTRGIFP
jgi:glutamate dehydrogenase (NAD(P)+)